MSIVPRRSPFAFSSSKESPSRGFAGCVPIYGVISSNRGERRSAVDHRAKGSQRCKAPRGISEAGQTYSPSAPIRPNVERLLQDVLLPHILGIFAKQLPESVGGIW